MSDPKRSVTVTQTAGRDQLGNTAGADNMVEIGDITNFSNWVAGNSDTTNAELRNALTEAWSELEGALAAPGERAAVMGEYKKLAAEAVKPDRNPTALKMAWGAITSVVSAVKSLPALLKVGELLGLVPKAGA